MPLDPQEVAAFLRKHPEFFEDFAPLLADIQLPHPHGGRAISISERQVLTLREKSRLLEGKLAELIQFGEENDSIGDKVHRFAVALLASRSVDHALDIMYSYLGDDFAVPHIALRVWGAGETPPQRTEFSPVQAQLHTIALAMSAPVCGQHPIQEALPWFGESASSLKSFALVPLKHGDLGGLLILASEDASRFYPEMGSLFLKRIGELVSATLAAKIK
jgi:uncharacterized protein